MVPPFHPLDGDYDNIGRVDAQPDDQDESSPAFTAWLTRMSARMGEGADDDAESGNGTASAIDMAAEERYPTAPTPAQQLPPVAQGFPRQRATRHREPDPITQAIRIHAQAAQENAPERPSADEVSALLAAQRPASTTPTPEQAQIIDKARQILNDLPGPVVPED